MKVVFEPAVCSDETAVNGPSSELPALITATKPVKINISRGQASGSKIVKFKITNTEFGATAPAARAYKLTTTAGSCGGGVVSQVDADATTPGLQASALVPLGGTMRATLVAKMRLQNVTTTASNNPQRCSFDVSVVALDTDPAVDDGANPDGNTTTVSNSCQARPSRIRPSCSVVPT